MTNLELKIEVDKLNKQFGEMIESVQRTSQKMNAYDQRLDVLIKDCDRLCADLGSVKRAVQDLQNEFKRISPVKY